MKYSDLYEIRARGTPDFPIELYHIDNENARYIMPFHWHGEFEIIRVEEGILTLMADETEYTLTPGDIAFIGGGQIHGGVPTNCVYSCVVFDISMLCGKGMLPVSDKVRIAADSSLSKLRCFFPSANSEIHKTVDIIISALRQEGDSGHLTVLGALYTLFAELYEQNAVSILSGAVEERFASEHKLKKVIELIENNYKEPITLAELAETAEMNPKYFCAFFKKYTHRSPIEYINLYRIDSACRIMKTSDCTVTEAAFSCGYNDLSYFVKIFKKYKGMTPKQYKLKYEKFINGHYSEIFGS